MSNVDVLSMVMAGLALLLAAIVAVLMFTLARRKLPATSLISPLVGVRLVPSSEPGLGSAWRFQTTADAPNIAVDIFSFRRHGSHQAVPWQHELMDAPLTLTPGRPAYLQTSARATVGTAYDVSIGWTIRDADSDGRGSATMTVEAEPFIQT